MKKSNTSLRSNVIKEKKSQRKTLNSNIETNEDSNDEIFRRKSMPSFKIFIQKILDGNAELKSKLDNLPNIRKISKNHNDSYMNLKKENYWNDNSNTDRYSEKNFSDRQISKLIGNSLKEEKNLNFQKISSFSKNIHNSKFKNNEGPKISNEQEMNQNELNINEDNEGELQFFLNEVKNNKLIEIKQQQNFFEEEDEFEKYLLETGMTNLSKPKESYQMQNDDYLTPIKNNMPQNLFKTPEINDVHNSFSMNLAFKKVNFTESPVVINYEKKGVVSNLFLIDENGNYIKKESSFREKNKKEKEVLPKSILISKLRDDSLIEKLNEIHSPSPKRSFKRINKSQPRYLNYENSKTYNHTLKISRDQRTKLEKKNYLSKTEPINSEIIKRNIEFVKDIGESKRKILEKHRNFSIPKLIRSHSVCQKFVYNPIKFFSSLPPPVELETLNLSYEALNSYKKAFEDSVVLGSINLSHELVFNNNELNLSFEEFPWNEKVKRKKKEKMLIIDKNLFENGVD